LTFLN